MEIDYINPIDLCNKLNQVSDFVHVQPLEVELKADDSVCPARDDRTRFPHAMLLVVWTVVGILAQCSSGRIQCQQVGPLFPGSFAPCSIPSLPLEELTFATAIPHHQLYLP